jgi:hypothetical protein
MLGVLGGDLVHSPNPAHTVELRLIASYLSQITVSVDKSSTSLIYLSGGGGNDTTVTVVMCDA